MATHSSILARRILWTEEPGGLQCVGSHRADTTERLNTEVQKSQRTTQQCLHTTSHHVACVERWIGSSSQKGRSEAPLLGPRLLN